MELKGESISLSQIAAVAHNGEAVRISALAQPRILASRKVVEEIIARDSVVYGVTTGFGKFSDVRIPRDALNELQLNLVRSHACGIGAAAVGARGSRDDVAARKRAYARI